MPRLWKSWAGEGPGGASTLPGECPAHCPHPVLSEPRGGLSDPRLSQEPHGPHGTAWAWKPQLLWTQPHAAACDHPVSSLGRGPSVASGALPVRWQLRGWIMCGAWVHVGPPRACSGLPQTPLPWVPLGRGAKPQTKAQDRHVKVCITPPPISKEQQGSSWARHALLSEAFDKTNKKTTFLKGRPLLVPPAAPTRGRRP